MAMRKIVRRRRPRRQVTEHHLVRMRCCSPCRRPRLFHTAAASPTMLDAAIVAPPHAASSSVTQVYSSLSSSSSSSSSDRCLLDYARGWAWQQAFLGRRLEWRRNASTTITKDQTHHQPSMDTDCVLVLEHKPVYTLGRGADEGHLVCFLQHDNPHNTTMLERLARCHRGQGSARLSVDRRLDSRLWERPLVEVVDILADTAVPAVAPNGVPIYRVDRGGEVTFHGPGQLVVYPQLDLTRQPYQQDLHWYLRMVEQVVMEVLCHYGIDSLRHDAHTGVWVDDCKVAAVGVSSSRWITTHGFALNVNPDLSYFDTDHILPCGIEGKGVTSMREILVKRGDSFVPDILEVAHVTLRTMEKVFGVPVQTYAGDGDSCRLLL